MYIKALVSSTTTNFDVTKTKLKTLSSSASASAKPIIILWSQILRIMIMPESGLLIFDQEGDHKMMGRGNIK